MSAIAPFTAAPMDEYDTLPLSTAPSSLSSSSPSSDTVVVEEVRQWSNHAPFSHRRAQFRRCSTRLFLRLLFSLQLVLHIALLVASIALLARRSDIRQLLPADSEPTTVFRVLEQLPAWLLARSVVSVALSARRLRLSDQWATTAWEAAWCVVVMWLSTGVMAITALAALCDLKSQAAIYIELWAVVALLLLLMVAHIAVVQSMALFFPMSALTVNLPTLPLDQHYYDDELASSQRKASRLQGLTPQQLQSMPTSLYDGGRDDAVCAVCMDDVEVGQVERVLRCGHAYHQPCIDQWLLKKRVCPLCVRAVRPSQSRSSVGEWVVELAEIFKPVPHQPAEVGC